MRRRASTALAGIAVLVLGACGPSQSAPPPAPSNAPPPASTVTASPSSRPTASPAPTIEPALLPVGQIVFDQLSGSTEGPFLGVVTMGTDGQSRSISLPFKNGGFGGFWSPDGTRLFVNTFVDDRLIIGTLDPATGAWSELKPDGMTGELECSDWSPVDDTVLCSRGGPDKADDGIYALDVSTGATRRITTSEYHYVAGTTGDCGGGENRAVFSPTGDRIAYEQQRCGAGENPGHDEQGSIVVSLADGSEPKAIVPFGGVRTHPGGEIAWSPTDDRIAFGTQGGELSIVPAAGGAPQVFQLPVRGFVFGPTWSPDGAWLLVTIQSLQNGQSNLYLVAADGSSARQLTHDAAVEAFTDWGPSP